MLIDLSPEEIQFIKTGIYTAQFESVLPETAENEAIKALLDKLGANEWLLVHGENYFTLIDEYQCSECYAVVSGGPPEKCPNCGSANEYRGHTLTARILEDC